MLGDNGAGKSTLLKAALGIVRPLSGQITDIQARLLSEVDRASGLREKTGVPTGAVAINPVNGEEIPRSRLVLLANEVMDRFPELTFFEVATVTAFRHFASEGVELAVVEAGMGGRLDATNVLLPEVSVLTRISLDAQADRMLAERGKIDENEMWRTFNLGVGFCLVVSATEVDRTVGIFEGAGHQAWELGAVEEAATEDPRLVGIPN